MADQPTATERFIQGILPENPVLRQLLGLCPALAVTANMVRHLPRIEAPAVLARMIKRRINEATGSTLVEEKSYADYRGSGAP